MNFRPSDDILMVRALAVELANCARSSKRR
jgi:hypothetical protein